MCDAFGLTTARGAASVGAERRRRVQRRTGEMNVREHSLYRHYYYYGPAPARRGWAVGGCRRAQDHLARI